MGDRGYEGRVEIRVHGKRVGGFVGDRENVGGMWV